MGDHIRRGEEFEKKADKKINGWALLGSKYEDAADLLTQSANQFKLAKSWDKAGSVFIKLSNCHLKLDSRHEAATAYVDAASCYKKTSTKGAISCYLQAVDIYVDMGRYSNAAKYCKEIGELYELEQNSDKAILYFEKAADYYEFQESNSLANKCKLKVAEISAQLEQYQKAIQIYEDVARQSLNNNLLKYGVRGYLLNAGICQLHRGDVVAITNALEQYEDLATAIDEEDVPKLTSIIKEFDSISKLVEFQFQGSVDARREDASSYTKAVALASNWIDKAYNCGISILKNISGHFPHHLCKCPLVSIAVRFVAAHSCFLKDRQHHRSDHLAPAHMSLHAAPSSGFDDDWCPLNSRQRLIQAIVLLLVWENCSFEGPEAL
ncbi:hypothetical protein NC653_036885 [Populus alba x Populus x berolinensis]|uniref:Alpha-soluble NSF attachment protein n=1 Tax=Populus alba x Populus x berolinensis TaxID=444605 RepID=A0AAD6PVG5_9ROSI|nr:hypothetical protein NC653_036885 [Populus alba x Populus x berolinensis]